MLYPTFELITSIVFLQIATLLRSFSLLQSIGKESLFIYFFHMQLGLGIMNKVLFNHLPDTQTVEAFLLILKPFIVVAISYLCAFLLRRIATRINMSRILFLVGIR